MPSIGHVKSRTKRVVIFYDGQSIVTGSEYLEKIATLENSIKEMFRSTRNFTRYIKILLLISELSPEECYKGNLMKRYDLKYNNDNFSQPVFLNYIKYLKKYDFIIPKKKIIINDNSRKGRELEIYKLSIKSLIILSVKDEFKIKSSIKNHKPDVSYGSILNQFYLESMLEIPEERLKKYLNNIFLHYTTSDEHIIEFNNVILYPKLGQVRGDLQSIWKQFFRYVLVLVCNDFRNNKENQVVDLFLDYKKDILKILDDEEKQLKWSLEEIKLHKKLLKEKEVDGGILHDYLVLCDKLMNLQIKIQHKENLVNHLIDMRSDFYSRKKIERLIEIRKIHDFSEENFRSEVFTGELLEEGHH